VSTRSASAAIHTRGCADSIACRKLGPSLVRPGRRSTRRGGHRHFDWNFAYLHPLICCGATSCPSQTYATSVCPTES
jgi:hypothetical protein